MKPVELGYTDIGRDATHQLVEFKREFAAQVHTIPEGSNWVSAWDGERYRVALQTDDAELAHLAKERAEDMEICEAQ